MSAAKSDAERAHAALCAWTGPAAAAGVTVRAGERAGGVTLFHIDGVVAAPPAEVLARIREADLSGLAGDLVTWQIASDAPTPPFSRRIRYATRLPWPFAARRFVVEQHVEAAPGAAFVLGSHSVPDAWEDAPARSVEGHVVYSGYRISTAEAGSRLQRIIGVDLRASIPLLDSALAKHYRDDHARLSAPLSATAAAEIEQRKEGPVFALLAAALAAPASSILTGGGVPPSAPS